MALSQLISVPILLLLAHTSVAENGPVDDATCLMQMPTRTKPKHRQENRTQPHESPKLQGRKLPEFTINLDMAPEKRFDEVSAAFSDKYNEVYKLFADNENQRRASKKGSEMRGPEADTEFMGEIKGIAKATGLAVEYIQAQQLGGALQTLKGPYFKYLHSMHEALPSDEKMALDGGKSSFGKQFAGMTPQQIASQAPSFGCTGIIARDADDGTVWHARNLDYSFSHWVQPMTYNAKFTKGGKELFTAQMVFPYVQPFTAIRNGPNGYTYEMNSRYGDDFLDAVEVLTNLYQEKRVPSGWTARKVLENTPDYESAVEAFSNTPYPSKEYNIISGVKKGTILARDPDSLAYSMTLGPSDRYLVITNFDYNKNDEKEFIKKQRVKGVTPRVRVQKILDDPDAKVTSELLQSVLNDQDVMEPNTMFQSLMNVEKGSYTGNLPHCKECDCDENCEHAVNFLQEDTYNE